LLDAVAVIGRLLGSRVHGCGHSEKVTAESQFVLAATVAEKTVVANALESVRQEVKQKAPDELKGGKRHGFWLVVVAVILPLEGDLVFLDVAEAVVGNGHTVGVTANVVEDLFRPGEGRFGIDHPFGLARGRQMRIPLGSVLQLVERARELQLARIEGLLEVFQKQAAEEARQHAHGEKETGPAGDPAAAVRRKSTAGDDAVEMGMME